ncbi:FAD-dependent oxidoreductase [Halobacillus yeomjeoni]|uniref:FAD-dependent oxidoreductase n=1 Tax=Halobacillus yeomjeoni TaxID=311194 RepID=A0A931HXD3_9BACI|nr:FAD-dependent oxidoreductase [Halobacillus yeomjeoni]MBH0231592.1 FAD-dependent oxidoreductase [Halobacillus yeomjeoni]
MSKRLLLIGAGHSHMEVMRQLKNEAVQELEVCLITPSPYQYYSGMFSGYTEGLYEKEDIRIDVKEYAQCAGIHFIQKKAWKVNPDHRKLICEDGSVYPFDVISFDIGSRSLPHEYDQSIARSIKPNYEFIHQMDELRSSTHPLIVGGGAAGTELAMSIHAYKQKHGIPGQVRVVTAERVLSDASKRTSGKLKSLIEKKGIQLWEGERVAEVEDHHIKTDKGNKIRHTGVLWLGGAISDDIFKRSRFSIEDRGFAIVRSTLQFKDYDFMFGAGDCVTMEEYPQLAKSGVYAVRQGPVLWENLNHYLKREPLKEYDPQKKALYILSTGGKKGFFIYGPLVHHSHRAWKIKNKIDREFMDKYKK